MSTRVTRLIEIDAGHRVPDHASKCRHPHGHRYRIRATCEGPLQTEGASRGMVIDFGLLKLAMMAAIDHEYDHAFIVDEGDALMRQALSIDSSWRVVVVPDVPTAENLARWWCHATQSALKALGSPLRIVRMEVDETPNCTATYEP